MDLFQFFLEDASKPFSGWDFSYVANTGRMVESPLKWSYTSLVLPLIRQADSLLDMGTGGGEFLAQIRPLPQNSFATEGYQPNIPIAKARLEPLGVQVVVVEDDKHLELPSNFFDVVINRHESYCPGELGRILKDKGQFITQQVGADNCIELNQLLAAKVESFHWDMTYAVAQLEKAGFEIIEQKEDFPLVRFFDIGAILFYLKAIPWQIRDFTVEEYYPRLKELHEMIQDRGFLDIPEHRFLIKAVKK